MKMWVGWRCWMILLSASTTFGFSQLPPDFHDERVLSGWNGAVGIEFIDSNHWLVWERTGRVWLLEGGMKRSEPVLDISREVMGGAEHGLLSMAIDPEFKETGRIYLTYTVEPWYLDHPIDQEADPDLLLDQWGATIGRVTRYQVDLKSWIALEPSRQILLGSTVHDGIPVLSPSHGIGGMAWGSDGSLLIATGDGTTWVGDHTGGSDYKEFGYDSTGLAMGIIGPDEDLGSYRAQYLRSYSGKILRINPESGHGYRSNPFFDEENPDLPVSKVWALGLRNPFRMIRIPNSGSIDPMDGDPGRLIIGDVGRYFYEEINIADGPAFNFGWPSYEGFSELVGYQNQRVLHPLANRFAHECRDAFLFDSLLRRASGEHGREVIRCGGDTLSVHPEVAALQHEVPILAYGNSENFPETTYVPFASVSSHDHISIDDSRAQVDGQPFDGISGIVGDFYQGSTWPEAYDGIYFHADFSGWIKCLLIDQHDRGEVHQVLPFLSSDQPIVYVKFNPYDECLYYIVLDYGSNPIGDLRRICFGGNARPVAEIDVDRRYGETPFTFLLSGGRSSDDYGSISSYHWILEGDTIHRGVDLSRSYARSDSLFNEEIELVVTDDVGQIGRTTVVLSLNNSPPTVEIISPDSNLKYDPSGEILDLSFLATATDAEHASSALKYCWSLFLDHNSHSHLEFSDTSRQARLTIQTPPETPFSRYSYRLRLEVSDPLGLCGVDEITLSPDQTSFIWDKTQEFLVYPNPNHGRCTVKSSFAIKQLTLYSMLGVPLKIWPAGGFVHEVDLHDLAGGPYVLIAELEYGVRVSRRIQVHQ